MRIPPFLKVVWAMICACMWFAPLSLWASERLGDGGLEASTANGTFPDSGFWIPAFSAPGASAICTTTAGHSGNATTTNGLWIYTGNAGSEWWSAPYQQTSASVGNVFVASAWIRTPPGEQWVAGSTALIRVDFTDASSNVLASYQSSALTTANTGWAQFQITTAPAPARTTRATYTCYLSKPSGNSGVSVANFDDCSLVDAPETLLNTGFEDTFDWPGVGPFPTNWLGEWLGESGAVAITPADYTNHVLWEYTGNSSNDWWVAIRQQKPASRGQAFSASASMRTPPGQPWVNGSQAYFRVVFLNAANGVIAGYQSPILTAPNPNWTRFNVVTEPAPTNTVAVRLTCYLIKSLASNGQSIVNFDDCSLEAISVPGARVSCRVLGLTASQTSTSFELRNTGLAPLNWQILENIPWLTAPVTNGTIPPLTAQFVTLNVNRAGLSGPDAIKGSLTLTTNDKDIPMDIYMDMPTAAPPSLPAEVRFYGRQLRVRDRLADGTLSAPYHYVINGSGWSPASIGTSNTIDARRQEFLKWYIADIQLHRAMRTSTVYCFLDFGTDASAFQILDNLYKNGLKAIVTVDEDGTGNSNRLQQIVTAYRNHPAILAWAIGNEWNINFYHGTFSTLLDSANATEALARQVKALDTNHPVAAIFGDIDIPGLNPLRRSDENVNQPISTERIVNDLCPTVDFWGLNIYRGATFGNVFTQWSSISTQPMYFSEYGTDAYRSSFLDIADGREDETMQADANHGLWKEIGSNLSAFHPNGICVGGTVFEWSDEWWKVRDQDGGSGDVQENLGYYGGQPDGFANEEWFGIVTADRRLRQSYFDLRSNFALTAPADLDQDGLPDAWEYRLIDLNGSDSIRQIFDLLPGDDFDGDHSSNLSEYLAGTDPANPLSVLRLSGIVRSNQTVRIEWIGGTNATQYLERTSSLTTTSSWVKLLTNNPPTAVTNQFTDTNPGSRTNFFYRIRVTQ